MHGLGTTSKDCFIILRNPREPKSIAVTKAPAEIHSDRNHRSSSQCFYFVICKLGISTKGGRIQNKCFLSHGPAPFPHHETIRHISTAFASSSLHQALVFPPKHTNANLKLDSLLLSHIPLPTDTTLNSYWMLLYNLSSPTYI
jgi:hypothetical protein